MGNMRRVMSGVAWCVLLCGVCYAQVDLPTSKGVYGGSVIGMESVRASAEDDISRLFISTESANSVFYADVNHSATPLLGTNFAFNVVPDLSASANLGAPRSIAVHRDSGRVYAAIQGQGIFSAGIEEGSMMTNAPVTGVPSIMIHENYFFYTDQYVDIETNYLFFGAIDADGAFTLATNAPVSIGGFHNGVTPEPYMAVHPTNNHVYFIDAPGENLMKSENPVDTFADNPSFSAIPLPVASTNWVDEMQRPVVAFGFGPDGRLFVGGLNTSVDPRETEVTFSDDDGQTWSAVQGTGQGGINGKRITTGSRENYWVYFVDSISTNKGESWNDVVNNPEGGCWGQPLPDSINDQIVFLPSEMGLAASTNSGLDGFDVSRGIEAEHITDFDMTEDMNIAWTTSQSGVRRTDDFHGACVWSQPMHTNVNIGATLSALSVLRADTNGLSAYVGAQGVAFTDNGGVTWTNLLPGHNYQWQDNPGNYCFANQCYASALATYSTNMVAVGFRSQWLFAETNKGQVFLSLDAGNSWQEISSEMSSQGLNVGDLIFVEEEGAVALYTGSSYEPAGRTGYGIYRTEINGSNVNVTHDFTDLISIGSFAQCSQGRLFAAGFDDSSVMRVYVKESPSSQWEEIDNTGLPQMNSSYQFENPSIAVGEDDSGNDALYMAAEANKIYMLSITNETGWVNPENLRYPESTAISFVFWDDLMVGTTEGLFEQKLSESPDPDLVPAYRFYSYGAPESTYVHLWTINEVERAALMAWPSWREEGIGWYALPEMSSGAVPLYRLYEPNIQRHLYTINVTEYVALTNTSWNGEGVQYYVYPTNSVEGLVPAYRFYNSANQNHHFTVDENEKETIIAMPEWGYTYEDIAFYVFMTNAQSLRVATASQSTDAARQDETALIQGDVAGVQARPIEDVEPVKAVSSADINNDNTVGVAGRVVYNEQTGRWSLIRETEQSELIPVPGDYNGDGKEDIALYEEAKGAWFILPNEPGFEISNLKFEIAPLAQWGGPGFVPVALDYDDDGLSDLAVYHKETDSLYVVTVDGYILAWGVAWGLE